ncbi:hypothetical protein DPMN_014594 [Dreissena polymorpha]|uniref:Uncharacterized protein n=1 Tax=Dreissena polymorpha TaxID=45954 RepID=A0A9D4N7L2_DREPO|nr:hypothetical protein DPMN_014594 [Dreissena polymorpha]
MAEDGQCVNLVKITNMAILFTLPVELTFVKLETLTPEDFIGFATVLEEYVLTTYALSCEICHTTRSFGYVMMRLAVNSTCPMETLRQIAREMSTTLTYLNVTIGGRLITVPVFANLATFEPQLKPYVTGCEEKVYFVAGLAIPVQDCPSVQLSFANMEQAGITKAEFSKLSFSGCIGMKSNDPNMLNISYFRNISDNCPPSHLEMNASRMYTVCIDSYFRLRNSASSLKWSDLLRFSIAVFVIFNMCLFILTCM